jgi:hypothetical protein
MAIPWVWRVAHQVQLLPLGLHDFFTLNSMEIAGSLFSSLAHDQVFVVQNLLEPIGPQAFFLYNRFFLRGII